MGTTGIPQWDGVNLLAYANNRLTTMTLFIGEELTPKYWYGRLSINHSLMAQAYASCTCKS